MRHLYLPLALLTLALLSLSCASGGSIPSTNAPATGASPAIDPGQETQASPAESQAPDLDAELPLDPAVRHGRLDNGFTYYIRSNAKPENRTELWLVVNTGSLMEDEDQLGLAHFIEHMAFNGTKNFAKQEITDYLEKIGMRIGADLNASTGFDETTYTLRLPTDDPEILDNAFAILRDWADGVSFEAEEVDKERGVLVEEWRLGRGASARIRDQQFPVLFRGSRYAERLPIGSLDILQNAPPETLRRFYQDWYRPDLMALVAVGDFDPASIEERTRQSFASLRAPQSPRTREAYPVPDHDETLFAVVTDPEVTTTAVSIYYKHPRSGESTLAGYRRSLVESMYHGMLNARLGEVALEEDPPFLFASSSAGSMVRAKDIYLQSAGVRDNDVARALRALLTESRRVRQHGFQPSELDRLKKEILRAYERAHQEKDKIPSSSFADEYRSHFLEDVPAPGIEAEVKMAQAILPTITVEEVGALAGSWITEANRVILLRAPEKDKEGLPTEDELLAMLGSADQGEVEPWVDRVVDSPLLPEMPTPGRIAEETELAELGLTHWRLANGIQVYAKPTDFKNDQVLMAGFSPGGHSLVPDADYVSGVFADVVIGEGGLGVFDQVELEKALAGKQVSLSAYVEELEEGITGGTSPQDLETLLQLLYLQVTAPREDPEAVRSYLTKLQAMVENRLANPGAVFQDAIREALYGNHPRRRPMSPELLNEIDQDRSAEIFRQRFADMGDFTFLFVGNLDLASLRPLVETYLGSLPSTGREETWHNIGLPRLESVKTVRIKKGLEPRSQVRLTFGGPAEWGRPERYVLGTLADVFEMRLRELLREEKGAVYRVGVSGGMQSFPEGRYSLSISFGCAPEKVDELVESVFTEIRRVQAGGINPEHLAKTKEAQLRSRQVAVQQNGFWLGVMKNYLVRGLDLELVLDYETLVQKVDPEALQKAANLYFDFDRYLLAVLDPEAAPEPSPDAP